METLATRLKSKVNIDPITGCWIWIGQQDKTGPRLKFKSKSMSARKASYEAFVSQLPNNKRVYCKCNNLLCINPEHLFTRTDPGNGYKVCYTCSEKKLAAEFNKNKRESDGLAVNCKTCRHIYENALRAQLEVKDRLKKSRSTLEAKIKARTLNLKNNYSITMEEYEKMLKFQEGGCAICHKPPKTKAHGVDHCHKTGLIRGLLCPNCNVAIAKFKDNIELLTTAVQYLSEPPATKVLGEPRFGIKGRISNKAATKRRLNPERYSDSK